MLAGPISRPRSDGLIARRLDAHDDLVWAGRGDLDVGERELELSVAAHLGANLS